MKTQKESTTLVVRDKYTAQFKEQALERADRDGIPKVAQDFLLFLLLLICKLYFHTKRP